MTFLKFTSKNGPLFVRSEEISAVTKTCDDTVGAVLHMSKTDNWFVVQETVEETMKTLGWLA